MRGMNSYTQAAMERAMKVQEVLLQAMAKKISWWQAAEILGISDRHMRRWRERYACLAQIIARRSNGVLACGPGVDQPRGPRLPIETQLSYFGFGSDIAAG